MIVFSTSSEAQALSHIAIRLGLIDYGHLSAWASQADGVVTAEALIVAEIKEIAEACRYSYPEESSALRKCIGAISDIKKDDGARDECGFRREAVFEAISLLENYDLAFCVV